MEEFIFDLLLLVIGIIIGRGFTLDQIEEGR
nr:MAG TPA: 60S acidic ribosomal protein P0 [Caudoviricetes sp.]